MAMWVCLKLRGLPILRRVAKLLETAPRNETMVETVRFVGNYKGIELFQGSLGSAGFRPSIWQ